MSEGTMEYKIAPSECHVFFGIRYLTAEIVDKLADPRVLTAKKHRLSVWWGRRYPPRAADVPAYFLLIGEWFGRAAYDGSCEHSVSLADLSQAVRTVAKRLAEAGFADSPELWLQCAYN
jgi:hypothetical protein